MSAGELDGRVAIVTGAGRGLGRAYALALAGAGGAVVVNDVDDEAARETVEAIRAGGGDAWAVLAPVGPSETAQQLVESAVSRFGRLDALVTNAGVLRDGVLWKMSDEAFDEVITTHLRGTFTCARAAAIQMRDQGEGGRIIVIGSPAGQHGNFGQTNYGAAKAGVVAFARIWSLELARSAITVNAVIPTAWTRMTAAIPIYAPVAEALAEGEPLPATLRREHGIGMPEDCAALVVFLASDAGRQITGQAIGIGGDRLTLYSHPAELAVRVRDGGWDLAAIAAAWSDHFAALAQPSGITLPPLDLGGGERE
ncbi:MAG: SDR family NAD(P)-dependent oxidoreductase [Solirubrobacteraceae bacterium]